VSERRWRGAFLEVVTEEVALPNGRTIDLDIVRHPGASAVVPFVSESDVLLIRQYRYATGGTIWEVPAGKLDPGDDPVSCAHRELAEEAGLASDRLEPLGFIWPSPGFTDEKIHLFMALDCSSVPQNLQDDEVIELERMPFARALEMVFAGEIPDAKSALALLQTGRRRGLLGS
jgi:ADP-ribose pyrophosphatase